MSTSAVPGSLQQTVPFLDLTVSQRLVQPELDDAWRRVSSCAGYVGGPEVEGFEEEWSRACQTTWAVGVGNGTDALELALAGLGVGVGDEVVVPGNTFIATASAVVSVGAVPVFVDVDPSTLLITPETVLPALTSRTAAVVVVHLFGQAADMTALGELAQRAGVALVEDCAQAHGARWDGRHVGSFGDAGCFSFYPGKNLGALGDAGAVVTSRGDVAERVRRLADHGRNASSKYQHDVAGRNSRLDALQAAVLRVKLRHLEVWNDQRRTAHTQYEELLTPSAARFVETDPRSTSSRHLEVVRVRDRARVMADLADVGITTGIHYPVPCGDNPGYRRFARGGLPVVEQVCGEILSLPMFPGITAEQVAATCSALAHSALRESGQVG